MAKQQSFADKAAKAKAAGNRKTIKLIYSVKSEKSNSYKFSEKFLSMAADVDENKAIEEFLKKSSS
jgi:hypothetical protein